MENKDALNQTCLLVTLLVFLSFAFFQPLQAQQIPQGSVITKTRMVAHKMGEPAELLYDYGKVRILVDSADTNGAWSLIEITEQPGYKTPIHRHNTWDESFYVLEGTLTATIADSIHILPAGSYILIPRGTPHGQANFGSLPVKLLMSITPSGFERHIKDRVELHKTIKPSNLQFPMKMDSLRKKNAKYIEILGPWEKSKN